MESQRSDSDTSTTADVSFVKTPSSDVVATTCLKCKTGRVKNGHFCQSCKAAFKAEADRKRKRIVHAKRGEMAAELLPHLCEHHGQELVRGTRKLRKLRWDYVQGLPDPVTGDSPPLEDLHHWDYLRDALTERGPVEGVSATYIQVELDMQEFLVSTHPWWTENPHWNFEVHDDIAAREWLDLPVCGDAKGTEKGYARHKAAKEMACVECSAGHAAYEKARRGRA